MELPKPIKLGHAGREGTLYYKTRQDSSRTVRLGNEILDMTDLFVSERSIRAIVNGNDLNRDALWEPTDKVLLMKLELLP
jgi:hypothetical protein